MATRTPPRWFTRKLADLDRDLEIAWSDTKNRWIISEKVRAAVRIVHETGLSIFKIRTRLERVFYAEELGTHVLDWVRRSNMRRFESVEAMVREMGIDKNGDNGQTTGFSQALAGRTR